MKILEKRFGTEVINYLKNTNKNYSITLYVLDSNIGAQDFYVKMNLKNHSFKLLFFLNSDGFLFKFTPIN